MIHVSRSTAIAVLTSALAAGCGSLEDDLEFDPSTSSVEQDVTTRDHRNPSTGGSAHELDVTPVFELPVRLTAGVRVVFQTRNRSANSDPMLHLLAPVSGNGAVTEVARNDDSAGDYNARLSYTPPTTGTYLLIMRATWKRKSGTADLLKDGRLVWPALPFGGAFQRLENLRVNEELTTVPLARAALSNTMYVLDDYGRLLERYPSGFNQSAFRRVTAPAAVRIAMVGVSWLEWRSTIRLVRNDRRLSGHDSDGDGLGNELEAAIGTCSTTSDVAGGFACSRAVDMRDTDGDGLTDAVELLGKVDAAPAQTLPRWGANPRHKDMFIEVDFHANNETVADVKMSPALAHSFGATWGDRETNPLFRLANAQTLVNPDAEPGISLHLDTGQDPPVGAPESDYTLYGNWGGHNRVPPVCDNEGKNCEGAEVANVWTQQMVSARRGLFRYIGTYEGSGGQTPVHKVYASVPLDDQSGPHELGHSLGLGHNGPHDGERFDANCKPNYASLMNYAYLGAQWRRFSDGYGRPAINNVALAERSAVPSPTSQHGIDYLDHLENVFGYNVDRSLGHVDWNRDGAYQSGTVRAYANDNGNGCEYTKLNQVRLSSKPDRAPALVRIGTTTYMLSINANGKLVIEYIVGSLECSTLQIEGCSGATPQLLSVDQPWNQDLAAVDAHRIVEDGKPRLLIVYRTQAGALYEVTYSSFPAGFSTPKPFLNTVTSDGELSLAGDDTTVYMAYRILDGVPVMRVRTNGVWSGDELARDANGDLLPRMGDASPTLLQAGPSGNRTIYAIFPEEDQIRLFTFDRVTRRFSASPWSMADHALVGKAAMAWVRMPASASFPGRLHIMWIEKTGDQKTMVKQQMLVAKRDPATATTTLEMGVAGDHQNTWYYGYAVALLFEEDIDNNLRLLVAEKKPKKDNMAEPQGLVLRPKADGIVDNPQRNWNDWAVLRVDLCRQLVNSGSSSLNCPAWIW